MIKIVGVRFRNAGKVYYFDPKHYELHNGGHVIVETARGVEYGTVIGGVRMVEDDKVIQPLRAVLREATAEDNAKAEHNRAREKEALHICNEKIRKHHLEMKLIDAEYTFDNSKLLFYFTADGRIDFRELVKDLAAVFRMRIELRQVGVRDETKILGGIGICGRVLCCHSYLSDFVPVSIRMAKEQSLSLNPTKISGVCGRLMCCLKNEQETYEYLNSRLPAVNDTVITAEGRKGAVQSVSVLRQRVKVLFEENGEKEIQEIAAAELTFQPRRRKGGKGGIKEAADEEMAEAGVPDEKAAEKSGRHSDRRSDKEDGSQENRGEENQNGRPDDHCENRKPRDRRENRRSGKPGTDKRDGRENEDDREKENAGGREPESREERAEGARRDRDAEDSRNARNGRPGKERRNRGRTGSSGESSEDDGKKREERAEGSRRDRRNRPDRGADRARAEDEIKESAGDGSEPAESADHADNGRDRREGRRNRDRRGNGRYGRGGRERQERKESGNAKAAEGSAQPQTDIAAPSPAGDKS